MIKRLLVIIGLVSAGLAAWPASADGTPVQRLGSGVATAIAVAPDGATLAIGSSVGVWFLAAATLAPVSFWDTGQWVQAVAYSADGRYLRAGNQFYDTSTGTAALLVPADMAWQAQSPAPADDCSPDGRRCLVYNLDNLIVRDANTQIDSALLRTGLLFGAAWAPDGGTIYTVVSGGVQAWDAGSGSLKRSQMDFFTGAPLVGVHWSADSTRVASGYSTWDIRTGQAAAGMVCGTAEAAADCAQPLAYLPDPESVVVLDSPSASTWRELAAHDTGTTAAAVGAGGRLLVTSGRDLASFACPGHPGQQCQNVVGSTRVWAEQTFKRLGQIPAQFYSVALSPDGRLVIGQTLSGIEAWDWAAGQQVWANAEPLGEAGALDTSLWHGADLNWSHALAISPDGRYAASYANQSSATNVSLWRVATGERVATLTGHTAPGTRPTGRLGDLYDTIWWRGVGLRGLAFSPDGKHLAASSLDGTMLVWTISEIGN